MKLQILMKIEFQSRICLRGDDELMTKNKTVSVSLNKAHHAAYFVELETRERKDVEYYKCAFYWFIDLSLSINLFICTCLFIVLSLIF